MENDNNEIVKQLKQIIDDSKDFDEDEVDAVKQLVASRTVEKVDELHAAFFKPPSSAEPDLFSQIREAVRAYNNASWVFRKAVWIIPSIGLLLTSGESIILWLKTLFGGVSK